MIFSISDLIMTLLGFIFLVIWLTLYFSGLKNKNLFDNLDEKEFPLHEVYFIGYSLLEKINYKFSLNFDRKLRKELGIIYDNKYSDYYLRAVRSSQITLSLTGIVVAFIFGILGRDFLILGIFIFVSLVLFYFVGTLPQQKIKKRSELMMSDFAEVVSKLALLTNSGMILKEAWENVAESGEGVLFEEMRLSVEEINNGVSNIQALSNFGARSMVPEIKKVTAIIVQGLIKGNAHLVLALQEQSSSIWHLKQQSVKSQGERANSKLLLPMMIMFVGILLMIIVPIFANLGM